MEDVLGVVVFPEPVVDAVEPDIDEMEIVPLLVLEQVTYDLELGPAHGEDLVAKPGLVVGSKALDVDRVMADELADLFARAPAGA